MKIGRLRKRIQIQQNTQVQSEDGQPVDTYLTVANVWASIDPVSAREFLTAGQLQGQITHKIGIRYGILDVTTKHRILWTDGVTTRTFNIQAVLPDNNDRDKVAILCLENI